MPKLESKAKFVRRDNTPEPECGVFSEAEGEWGSETELRHLEGP